MDDKESPWGGSDRENDEKRQEADQRKSTLQRNKSVGRISVGNANNKRQSEHGGEQNKSTFVDAAAMKEKVREKLSKPKYSVTDYYHETGCSQKIARSGIFDKVTLSVIAFNALWIAIDTDMNHSALLLDAKPVFIIAENFFCVYFTFEWVVRFLSFRLKYNGLKDAWFVFDTFMVSMMVLETWVFTILIVLIMPSGASAGGAENAGIMRLARLLRLSRMARMGKLLRVMPELMIMIKGMKASTRSVFFTLVLLVVIMYVYAIAFVQLSSGTDAGEKFFSRVPESMYTLLMYGIFLDNVGFFVTSLHNEWILAIAFFSFVLLGTLTVMNMLVGVLCEVVSAVAATEQEEMLVNYVNEKISRVMALLDSDGGGSISKKEFLEILDNVEAVRCLSDVGVDVFALIDLADYIFEDDDTENQDEIELDFSRFMEVVLQLRGTNQATVKDIVDLRKFMRLSMQENFKQTTFILDKLSEGAKITETMMCNMVSMGPEGSTKKAFEDYGPDFCMQQVDAEGSSEGPDWQRQASLSTWEVEGGIAPVMPAATPNGQLLSWVPIGITQLHSTAAQYSDELALKGSWSALETTSVDADPRIPKESEADALSARYLEAHWHHRRQGDCANAQSGGKPTAPLKIPKLQFASTGAGPPFDDSDLKEIQAKFEWICGQLASSLKDAIDIAGRSVERTYANKSAGLNHVNGVSALPAEGGDAAKGTYVL